MTDSHTELCERLRDGPARVGVMRYAADLIESQAARIQQQALEYVSLFDQCSEHLARVSQLEILLDSERVTNKALSDENAILADLQPQELLARVAELDAACKRLALARATDPVCVKWYADQFDADQVRIAELEKERDALKADAIERCAKVCDEWQRAYVLEHCCDLAQDNALKSVAAAIRALLPKEE